MKRYQDVTGSAVQGLHIRATGFFTANQCPLDCQRACNATERTTLWHCSHNNEEE